MDFKNEFTILKYCFSEEKTKYWTSKDVKSFDGVVFDNKTGVVMELELRDACLRGSLSANSSLFRLNHLRYLDLSVNYFDSFSFTQLGKLTNLEVLGLSNMGLAGEIPSSVSRLNRLTILDLSGNELIGSFSPLLNLSKLSYLDLFNNHFSGNVPSSLLNLSKLSTLSLHGNNFSGNVPCSLLNLSKLSFLDLSNNHFSGKVPCSLLNLSRLSYLELSNNHFSGKFSCSLLTMPLLSYLGLSQNHLTDSLETMNCSSSSNLDALLLSYNRLSGRILDPLSKLSNLKYLDLSFQNTTDPINFVSLGFKSLKELYLSENAISRLSIGSQNLSMLYLDSCSINEFPTFIKNQQKLEFLDMGNNRLKGEVRLWSLPSLNHLVLSHNYLDSFEGSPTMLLNSSLEMVDLRSNAFRGSLPIFISPTLESLLASNNSFTGDIPLSLCNQSSLRVLDLSHNNFSGSVPPCLINSSVETLNLQNNNLIGIFPDIFSKSGILRRLDISHNQITGKLPRSLTNCRELKIVNVEGNRIIDTFPFWLKDQLNLIVMVLRSNMFHGPIYSPQHPLSFPQLRIIDISRNRFSGSLPQNYFVNWSMPLTSSPHYEYSSPPSRYTPPPNMYFRNKGINMQLEYIVEAYKSIDFSENKLGGQIPESIGLLKLLVVLNLSSNDFSGHIPSSWANLASLESLDLSRNQLTGKIPQELATLSFLEYINVSHNKLTGQIPQGTQIIGQPKSSFEGNLNLCGLPLEESCFGDKAPSTPEAQEPEPPKKEQVLNWKAAAMGYGPGVLFGLMIGQVLYSYRPVLFYKLFRL